MIFNYLFIIISLFFNLLLSSANAENYIKLPKKALQGELIISQISEYNESDQIQILNDKNPLKISKHGYFVFA
mgnify:CR=1